MRIGDDRLKACITRENMRLEKSWSYAGFRLG